MTPEESLGGVSDLYARLSRQELEQIGKRWAKARKAERTVAAQMYAVIKSAADVGIPEAEIARLAGVDRMTVRKALGKRQ